jgi:ribose transport system substrate-binding protein
LSIVHILKILTIGTVFASVGAGAEAYNIGVSLLTQQHPFYIALADAMKQQAAKTGVKLDIAIANQDLNKQISDVEDFISKRVNAIILSPVDSRGVKAAVAKAQKAGIPLITVDIAANGIDVTCHVATDNYAGGVKAGELMAKALGGNGRVGIIDYPTVQSVMDRVAGFKKALSSYPNMKIVSIQPGITRAEALAVAQNMLQANPDLNGIFGFGDDAALAALVAVKSASRANQVKIIGFDGMQEARNAVDKEASFIGVIRQYPEKMGAIAVDAAVNILRGQKVSKVIPVEPGVYTRQSQN